MAYNTSAGSGNIFILTDRGYEKTPEGAKPEREAGKPVRGYEYKVPTSWIQNGYVEERREHDI